MNNKCQGEMTPGMAAYKEAERQADASFAPWLEAPMYLRVYWDRIAAAAIAQAGRNDMTAETALAESWASMDGKLDQYRAEGDPDGHFDGYNTEAREMLERLRRRGFTVVPLTKRQAPAADGGGVTRELIDRLRAVSPNSATSTLRVCREAARELERLSRLDAGQSAALSECLKALKPFARASAALNYADCKPGENLGFGLLDFAEAARVYAKHSGGEEK